MEQGGHANIIVIDHKNKIIERFEPNGANPPSDFNYNSLLLDRQLKDLFEELKYSYLKDLQDIHDTSFIESEKCSIVVDANIDFENDEIKLNNIINQIFENVPYLKYFHIHHKINKFEYNNSVQNI